MPARTMCQDHFRLRIPCLRTNGVLGGSLCVRAALCCAAQRGAVRLPVAYPDLAHSAHSVSQSEAWSYSGPHYHSCLGAVHALLGKGRVA